MKRNKNWLTTSALAAAALALSVAGASAAADDAYDTNDLQLFFQNPAGTVGSGSIITYSLGSTWDLFRDAATPSDTNYGQVINLGNINATLTSTFGANWSSLNATIWSGAVGQKGSTNPAATALSNNDYARTVYVTQARSGAGTVNAANSTAPYVANASSGGLASAIQGANSVQLTQTNPYVVGVGDTVIDTQNPFIPSTSIPDLAYTAINGGVQGSISSSTYSFGSITGVVLGLDLYRITPVANVSTGAGSWEFNNSISGVTSEVGYYLGTITIGSNGDVNFTAIPEPSTALLALGGALTTAFLARRRRQTSTVQ